ncbi:MAG: AsmA-like C-terminal domain-containing protein [Deltaproteobacteria bacterium]|nr:AsmA-like C-terminal domain-containing protein [Deltaproteobacteria bacterium]
MKTSGKIAGVAGALGILVVLLLALAALLPRWINLKPVKARILAYASRAVEGTVSYEKVDLSYFPRPRIVIHRVVLSIPGKAAGTVGSLSVYPAIFPLLDGGYHLAKVRAEEPDLAVAIPPLRKPLSLAETREEMSRLLSTLSANAPGLVVEAARGRLTLSRGNRPVNTFRDVEARVALTPKALDVEIRCASNLWGRLAVKGSLDPTDLDGHGKIDLARLDVAALAKSLTAKAGSAVPAGTADLDVAFATEGFKVLRAEVRGSAPSLSLHRGDRTLGVTGIRLRGALRLEEGKAIASVSELSLESPRLRTGGRFLIDRAPPRVALALSDGDLDVAAVRKALLSLAGDVAPVKEVAEYLAGGKVSRFALEARGRAVSDLWSLDRLALQGHLREGTVFVRKEGLDLEDVQGNVALSHGILTADHVDARLGNSKANGGTLKVGLTGENAPFHLDAPVQADLAELPPLVKRLARNKGLEDELSLIDGLKGNATGRLTLGDRIDSIKVKADVSDFRLSARYRRIPFPVEITGGRLFYDGNRVGVDRLSGRLGNSTFADIAARVRLGDSPAIEGFSGRVSAALGELSPWLTSFRGMETARERVKRLEGSADLAVARLTGPLARPKEWRYDATGALKDVLLDASPLPGPVAIRTGNFHLVPEAFTVVGLDARVLDAPVRVSGLFKGYRGGPRTIDATVDGVVGPEAVRWIWDTVHIPSELVPRSPISVAGTRLGLDEGGTVSVAGAFAVRNGPALSLDLVKPREGLDIRDLSIRDDDSRATIALRLERRELGVRFAGHLSRTTVSRMFLNTGIRHGWLGGDFRADIPLDHLARSTAHGTLSAKDIRFPHLMGPLAIDELSLDAAGDRITVASSAFAWGETRFSLKGEATASPGGLRVDMDLSSGGIAWDNVKKTLPGKKPGEGTAKEEGAGAKAGIGGTRGPWPLPVTGIVRLATDSLTIGEYTWKPVRADVTLENERLTAAVRKADLCGIATTGHLAITPTESELDFRAASVLHDLNPALTCFRHRRIGMTGRYDLSAHVAGRGKGEALSRSLHGDFEFRAAKGRISKANLLAKILALLNVTQVFLGKLPDLGHEGFAYNSLSVKGTLSDGKLAIREAVLDGKSMNIVGHGDVDLRAGKVNIVALASPLKTVDTIIRMIPVLRYILGGSLVTVAVKATGDLDDPSVVLLPPSAVGEGVVGIVERVLKLPVRIFEPGVP